MFDELQALSDNNDVIMTVYVDDVVFSSEHNISSEFRKTVLSLIRKYNYQVSRKKVKGYSRTYPKLVTGVIINSEGKATVKNSLRKKIMNIFAIIPLIKKVVSVYVALLLLPDRLTSQLTLIYVNLLLKNLQKNKSPLKIGW